MVGTGAAMICCCLCCLCTLLVLISCALLARFVIEVFFPHNRTA